MDDVPTNKDKADEGASRQEQIFRGAMRPQKIELLVALVLGAVVLAVALLR